MTKRVLKISKQEYDLLYGYLADAGKKLTDFNRQKLKEELSNSKILDENALPKDAIRLNSKVEVKEFTSGKKFNFQLVQPAFADFKKQKISILAPISIALIGYRKGALVDWEMPDGTRQYEVISVENEQ